MMMLWAAQQGGNFAKDALLAVDFKGGRYRVNGVQYSDPTQIPGWSFANSTGGFAENSDGTYSLFAPNVPRIGRGAGLTCEPAATNLFTSSAVLTTGVSWGKTEGAFQISATPSILPGQVAYDYVSGVVPNSTNNRAQVSPNVVAMTLGAAYTQTFLISKKGYQFFTLRTNAGLAGAGLQNVTFDLDNVNVAFNGITGGVPAIRKLATGVYVITLTATTPDAKNLSTYMYGTPTAQLDSTAPTFTGDGVSGFTSHNVQCELGALSTSPIVTLAAAATRSADNGNVGGQATPLTYPFTIAARGVLPGVAGTQTLVSPNAAATIADSIRISRASDDSFRTSVYSAGTFRGSASNGAGAKPGARTLCVASMADTTQVRESIDGSAVFVGGGLTGLMPAGLDTIHLGVLADGSFGLNGVVEGVYVYAGVADARLQQISAGGF